MKRFGWGDPAALLILAVLAVPRLAQAGDFSFTGTFATDDQVQLFDLSIASDTTVTFQSLGYGGGTNAANTVIPPGGFDSYFTWYDGSGNQIGTNDNGCGSANSYNDACLDAYAQVFLTHGNYVLALTESGNNPIGSLSQGFTEQGQGDFTASGSCTAFCDWLGNTDNGNWAVDISGVDLASEAPSTPEPITFALTFTGLSLLMLTRPRRA
jgi:hypothetical protein